MQADILTLRQYAAMRAIHARRSPKKTLGGLPTLMLQLHQHESLNEKAFELGLGVFAPTLKPIYQQIEELEESPNVSQQGRKLLDFGEFLIKLYLGYKVLQWLDS